MVDHSIKGKTVLIAGGGKNLGGLIARDLAAHGAKAIAIHYNSPASADETEETLAAVRAAGAEAVAFQADLTSCGCGRKTFRRHDRSDRPSRHRDQHGRKSAQKTFRRDQRGRI